MITTPTSLPSTRSPPASRHTPHPKLSMAWKNAGKCVVDMDIWSLQACLKSSARMQARTFEGENFVMWLQVDRYLIKNMEKIGKGEEVGGQVSYLASAIDPHSTSSCFPCVAHHPNESPLPLRPLNNHQPTHHRRAIVSHIQLTLFLPLVDATRYHPRPSRQAPGHSPS